MRYQNVARPGWSWLAFSVLLVTSSATILAWFFVRAQESSHVRSVTRLMTSTAHADLAVDVQNWVGDQVSLAKLWEFDDPSREEWALFAKLFIQEHRGCRAIAWLDANNEKRWVMSSDGQSFADVPLAKDGAAKPMLDKALRSRQVAFSNLLLTKGGETVHLSAAPIFQRNKFHGFVIAWINVRSSLDEMTADIKGLPMSLEVDEGGQQIYFMPGSNKENMEWAQSSELVLPGPVWQLRVWPTPMGMRTIRSSLPSLTLLFGALFSFLLTWLAYAHTRLKQEILERGRAEEAVKLSQARFSGILEISPAGVISTNENQRITLFNQSAEKIFGYRADEVLGQPLDMLIPQHFRAIHKHHFASFAQSPERSMLLSAHRLVFGRRKDGSEFPMAAALSKLDLGREKIFTALCSDMTREVRAEEELLRTHDELESRVLARTAALQKAYNSLESEIMERKAVEDEVLQLSGKIMRLQDEERRHLARELHDGTAQNLVALTLNLHRLREVVCHNEAEITQLEECVRMVEQCSNELRSIAYLLHPPMLEELGLSRALRGYVEGFEKRSRIAVTLACPEDLGPLEFEIQLTVFRIVQEGLSNILKHSQSASASIALSCEGGILCLEISDQGRGIPEGGGQSGVGLAGMRERVRLLHGQLAVRSSAQGTVMRVTLPLAAAVVGMAAGAGTSVLRTGRPRSARTRATDL